MPRPVRILPREAVVQCVNDFTKVLSKVRLKEAAEKAPCRRRAKVCEDLGQEEPAFSRNFCRFKGIDNVLEKSSFVLVKIWAIKPAFSRKIQTSKPSWSVQDRGLESLVGHVSAERSLYHCHDFK